MPEYHNWLKMKKKIPTYYEKKCAHVLIILLFFPKFYGNFGVIPWFLFHFEFLDIVPHWSISNLQRVVSQRKLIYKTPYLFPDLVLFSVKIYDYKCKNGQNQNAWMINWMATTMETALPNVLGPLRA